MISFSAIKRCGGCGEIQEVVVLLNEKPPGVSKDDDRIIDNAVLSSSNTFFMIHGWGIDGNGQTLCPNCLKERPYIGV